MSNMIRHSLLLKDSLNNLESSEQEISRDGFIVLNKESKENPMKSKSNCMVTRVVKSLCDIEPQPCSMPLS